jgi:hypothetical protein
LLVINPLNAKLNSICHLPALLGAHHILHVSRIRVKMVTFWNVTPYDLVLGYQCWRGNCCIHLMGRSEEEAMCDEKHMAVKKGRRGPGL